ncbi:MAG: histidine phosphatase family protein [Dehalococcoidia bacterium]|nr:histidine phosphatase family protein [Dehalococcoidia bacterium]
MSTRLLLVRHGQTDAAVTGRTQGRVDNPLNATGHLQAQALAARLSGERPAALYSSPASRAVATAAPLANALGLEVHTDPRLLEMDYGRLDDRTGAELRAQEPEFMARWATDDPADLRMPGGETMGEVQARMLAVVADLAHAHAGETVAAFSHGFAIRSLLCGVLGVPLASFRRIRVDLASCSVVEQGEGGLLLVMLNEVCHLET